MLQDLIVFEWIVHANVHAKFIGIKTPMTNQPISIARSRTDVH